ncbi:MAG: type II secretion system ATPase GspE [Sedimentisphaerales bacterium]|nr:type II secretion system ATPase GspE [Sedimentisphaerales bacterium]
MQPGQCIESISPEQLTPDLVRKLPLEFLKNQCAIPITLEDGTAAVALADPLNIEAYDAIVGILNQPCVRVVCPADEIEKAISLCYYENGGAVERELELVSEPDEAHSSLDASSVQTRAEDLLSIASKAPVVKLANRIFFQAVRSRASDIHIEPYENEARVRFRVDGVLHNVAALDRQQIPALLSRLKIMANLDIAESRLPQDGQSRIKIGEDLVDIRVSVIPTLGGERVMLRLLDRSRAELTLNQIGCNADVLGTFRRLISMPHGIILLTGPTGSGKTTSLYAALNELNCEERNILTVEDPIEYQLPGIGQMQVRPKIDLTFASCLRHILRQDPDVIMIGEIRDLETAEIAIQASLTGHLVLSTLHTNDSASAVTRLIDMGIEPYLISSSVVAVIAQRLVRVICPQCKVPQGSHEHTIAMAERELGDSRIDGEFYKGLGCESCLNTGYLGRTGIFEQMIVDDQIKTMITQRCDSHVVKRAAIEKGMITLRADGLRKALVGVTSLEEVFRVTQDSVHADYGVTEDAAY